MRVLFIFPHPDDESFGPAGVIHKLSREGHEVHLLTLTKGGATKERHKLGLDVEAMGLAREKEMRAVEKVLNLSSMEILDLPDSGLMEMDPRAIEQVVEEHINRIRPAVVVSYAVHGISGFPDHLVTHAVVKRLYLEMRGRGADYLKRLAFFALSEAHNPVIPQDRVRIHFSPPQLIDCVVELGDDDFAAFHAALDCYATYKDVIQETGVRKAMGRQIAFEFFQESFNPPADSLLAGL
jgi:N-acetylglucosamine malate deacetylase 2